jgi:hypothetical protein
MKKAVLFLVPKILLGTGGFTIIYKIPNNRFLGISIFSIFQIVHVYYFIKGNFSKR